MKTKIRDKVIALMVVLIIIPIVLLGWSSYNTSSKALKNQYEDLGKVIGSEAKVLVESKVDDTNKLISDLSLDPNFKTITEPESLASVLEKFKRTTDTYKFIDIYFANNEGTTFMGSGTDASSVDATERPWYIKALETDNPVWSEMYSDALTGQKAVTVSQKIYDGDTFIGVMGIDIDLDEFSKDILEVDIMGGHPIVMDKDGTIIIDAVKSNIGTPFEALDLFNKGDENVQTIEYTYHNKETDTSQRQEIVFSPVGGSDWNIATIIGMDALTKLNSNMLRNLIVIGLSTVLAAVLVAVLFGKNLSDTIGEVLSVIRKMESGDFTTRIHTKNTDEFGELRDIFNTMMDTLGAFIKKIKSASESVDEYSGNLAAISQQVSASSLEISKTAEEIARGASVQADDTESGVVLINEMSEKLIDLDSSASDMNNLTLEIMKTSRESTDVVEDLREKTRENNESSKRVECEIVELDKKISGATEILETIDQITEQTNLLALNASIEAARAGEYGKGFAVVADEIRKLAGESKESSNNIRAILEGVQEESRHTVGVVGEVGERNREQTDAVRRVSESFSTIEELISEITLKIKEIAKKSSDMNSDKDNIVSSIESISAVSEQTAAASEEVTASIEEQSSATEEVASSASKLNELSNELNKELSVFKV